jgi:hypothetical protein
MLQHRNMQILLSPAELRIQQEKTAQVWCRGISYFKIKHKRQYKKATSL